MHNFSIALISISQNNWVKLANFKVRDITSLLQKFLQSSRNYDENCAKKKVSASSSISIDFYIR